MDAVTCHPCRANGTARLARKLLRSAITASRAPAPRSCSPAASRSAIVILFSSVIQLHCATLMEGCPVRRHQAVSPKTACRETRIPSVAESSTGSCTRMSMQRPPCTPFSARLRMLSSSHLCTGDKRTLIDTAGTTRGQGCQGLPLSQNSRLGPPKTITHWLCQGGTTILAGPYSK